MRRLPWTGLGLSAVLSTVILSACSDQTPSGPQYVPATPSPIVAPTYAAAKGLGGESRYLFQFKAGEGKDFEAKVMAAGGKIARRHKEIGAVLVTGLSAAAANSLRARADVEEAGLDLKAQFIPTRDKLMRSLVRTPKTAVKTAASNDQSGAFFFDTYQWNLRRIKAPQAWRQTRAGQGTEVCDLNTGIDPRHIDLKGKVDFKKSTSFVASEPFIRDLNTHGTFVASNITSNGLGMASVAPSARLCAVKVLDGTGSGSFADVIAGIVYVGAIGGVDVINMSLGALLDYNDPDQRSLGNAIQKAVNFATNQGVLIVAGSGNNNLNLDQSGRIKSIPAQLNNVISVGATGPINQKNFDRLTSYSNYGVKGNDLVAPGGENILGITLDKFVLQDLVIGACSEFVPGCEGGDFYTWAEGTSFSSPLVAGAAAVTESDRAGNQSPATLTSCLLDGADNVGAAVFFGAGRLNVLGAASCGLTS